MTDKTGLAAVHAAAQSSTSAAAIERGTAPGPKGVSAEAAAPTQGEALLEARALVDVEAVRAAGGKEGASAERTRIQAIVGSSEAKGREALAQSLAFDTELSAEQAVKVLAKAPVEAKVSRLDGFVPQPKVSSEESAEEGKPGTRLAAAVTRQLAAKGLKPLAH